MKVKINQVDESNADLIIQQLKKENDQLHQLVNKYHESKNVNKVSDDFTTKKVGIKHAHAYVTHNYVYNNMSKLSM